MKILFLEDNLIFAEALSDIAVELGHTIDHTANVLDASTLFNSLQYDSVISDVHLKNGSEILASGLDFIHYIREKKHSKIVIAVTTGLELIQEQDMKDLGVDLFYHKPIRVGYIKFLEEIENLVAVKSKN